MKKQNKNLFIYAGAILVFLVMLSLWLSPAKAEYPTTFEYDITVTHINEVGPTQDTSDAIDDAISGAAVAMCLGGAQFDYAPGWQGSAGGAFLKSEEAFCGSFAKRLDDVLVTGGVGCDSSLDNCGALITGNWHF